MARPVQPGRATITPPSPLCSVPLSPPRGKLAQTASTYATSPTNCWGEASGAPFSHHTPIQLGPQIKPEGAALFLRCVQKRCGFCFGPSRILTLSPFLGRQAHPFTPHPNSTGTTDKTGGCRTFSAVCAEKVRVLTLSFRPAPLWLIPSVSICGHVFLSDFHSGFGGHKLLPPEE